MPQYNILVLAKPVPGREDEFESWYTNQHIHDLLKVPGFKTAQRFRILQGQTEHLTQQVIARYELETDDLAATLAIVQQRLGGPQMPMTDAFDMPTAIFLVTEPITEKLVAPAG